MTGTAATAAPTTLVLNAGSSSIKFALFESRPSLHRVVSGQVERIGSSDPAFKATGPTPGDTFSRALDARDHQSAAAALLDWLDQRRPLATLAAVGHRVVRGAPFYSNPERIDAVMVERLRQLSPFDTAHLPHGIGLIEAVRERCPQLPQVACFDTAFHRDMPRVATLLPIPRRYEAQGLRRLGFHGLSYEFLMRELARLDGPDAAHGRIVLAHLGNGASLAAVRGGKPVDTSMGFTPSGGVPMGTRSGDIDPGLLWYLARTENLGAEQINDLLNSQSGLLGVSETSADMRDLLERQAGDVRAAEAVALFCYQIKKCIGSYAAALGGIDTLVFSGGIGEHAPEVRSRICEGLGFLGIEIDADLNLGKLDNATVVSAGSSRVRVRVIRTDEESTIARSVCKLLGLPLAAQHTEPTKANHDDQDDAH
ncbi:MAG: acetate/propionate family kinase [Methylibium sp.]|nr:acetate/propionate family kinase [Methylibium sp.]